MNFKSQRQRDAEELAVIEFQMIESMLAELAQLTGMDESLVRQHIAATIIVTNRPLRVVLDDVLTFHRSIEQWEKQREEI